MNQLSLTLENSARGFEPGGQLVVTAGWQLDQLVPGDQYLELRLIWYTRGKGDTDVQTTQALRIDPEQASDTKRMGIQLPDSPYSFSGKLISLVWALEFVLEPGGDACREEFVMAPGGREILLSAAAGNQRSREDEEDEDEGDAD